MPDDSLGEVVSLFLRHDDPDDDLSPGFKALTVRMPLARLAWIDAMATQAGVSRNVMVIELVKVGIPAVLGALPDEISSDIAAEAQNRLERYED